MKLYSIQFAYVGNDECNYELMSELFKTLEDAKKECQEWVNDFYHTGLQIQIEAPLEWKEINEKRHEWWSDEYVINFIITEMEINS